MWGKPFVTHVENEFKTDKMRDKHVFHDVNLRVSDPEEFRMTSVEFLRGLGYIVDVNEMTEFEDSGEFSKLFTSGRLKPLKNVIKARKTTNTGSRFPSLWKILSMIGIVTLITYFLPYEQLNKEVIFYIMTISLISAAIFYLIKKLITSSVWIKIIGIYDVEGTKADIRAVISADTSDMDVKVFDKLRDEIAEFYDLISRKYIKREEKAEALLKPVTKTKTEEVITKIVKVNKDMEALRDKFVNGRVSEDVFKNVMNSLESEKDKLETIIDLVSL